MEAFYTIQGEGFYAGVPAYFIRLGGCDVGCVWCDVKESWDENAHPLFTIKEIVNQARKYPIGVVVITGGEPLMHNLDALTEELKQAGFRTHIETSGAHPLTGNWDWVCYSPKKFKKPLTEVAAAAHELKVVVYNKSDFQWAEQHAEMVNADCKLLLQPEWDKSDQVLPMIIDYVKANPQWRISLQTHKYMNVP
jgi:7-carboxy-7-deazaguanine synthase